MIYQTVESFTEEYRLESANTQKLLDALTDESLKLEVASGFRTLGHLAWHLVTAAGMLLPTGLKFEVPADGAVPPTSAAEIAQAYRTTVASVLEAVKSQWNDEKLQESTNMFGQVWKNGLTLNIFLKHEIHHRGQLTVLMRQAGLRVAGVYGPAKEEWAAVGMEAPAF